MCYVVRTYLYRTTAVCFCHVTYVLLNCLNIKTKRLSVCLRSVCAFQSRCGNLNLRHCACSEQAVLWRSSDFIVKIHSIRVSEMTLTLSWWRSLSYRNQSIDLLIHSIRLSEMTLTLSQWRSLSYRNQSINLHSISMNWFLHDRDLLYERVNKQSRNADSSSVLYK